MPKTIHDPELTMPSFLPPDAFGDAFGDAAQTAGELVQEARASTEVMSHAELSEILQVNQLVGTTAYARALDSVNKVTMLNALQRIKESKAYKFMVLPGPNGTVIKPKNWAGLCEALGLSRSKIDEDLQNLGEFGETMLEAQDSLGIGYRDLRRLRAGMAALPEAQQQEVKNLINEAIASNDKEEILATLDEMGVRNSKLSTEVADLRTEIKAKEALQSKTANRANELEMKLEMALNPTSESDRQRNMKEARKALRKSIDHACNMLVGEATTLCNGIINASKADTEAKDADKPSVIDADLWREINDRVGVACQTVRGLLSSAGLDVDINSSFGPGFDPSFGAEFGPDFAAECTPDIEAQQ